MKFRILIVILSFLFLACDEFVEIDLPSNALAREAVFADEETAEAALLDLYYHLSSTGFAYGGRDGLSYVLALSSDEQLNYYTSGGALANLEYQQFNDNELRPDNSIVRRLWADFYNCIYKANAIIEGSGLSSPGRAKITAEAMVIRSFAYFYLINLWGDVPLVLSTDYQLNSSIERFAASGIYEQIIADLQYAESTLPMDFALFGDQRVRATTWAAQALLARIYLYNEKWDLAAEYATGVISSPLFTLVQEHESVFGIESQEAILQWWSAYRANEWITFYPYADPPRNAILRPDLVSSFSAADLRSSKWIAQTASGLAGSRKYFTTFSNPPGQYSTVLRLAEMYLIRAEAFAHLGSLGDGLADLNRVRERSALDPLEDLDLDALLNAVEDERRRELFVEWGHRWLDLKRNNRTSSVLSSIKPNWDDHSNLFPIPEYEMLNNTLLAGAQNPGY
jgi:hypothetical protein